LPAWSATRGNTADALKDAGTRTTAGRRHSGCAACWSSANIALSLMLLATAGLLIRSFERLHEVSPGFSAENVLTAQLTLPAAKYSTPEKQRHFAATSSPACGALPGVTSAGLTSTLPFSSSNSQASYGIAGYTAPSGQPSPHGMIRNVSPDYFRASHPIAARGGSSDGQDTATREKVVIIDRILATATGRGRIPIGQPHRPQRRPEKSGLLHDHRGRRAGEKTGASRKTSPRKRFITHSHSFRSAISRWW